MSSRKEVYVSPSNAVVVKDFSDEALIRLTFDVSCHYFDKSDSSRGYTGEVMVTFHNSEVTKQSAVLEIFLMKRNKNSHHIIGIFHVKHKGFKGFSLADLIVIIRGYSFQQPNKLRVLYKSTVKEAVGVLFLEGKKNRNMKEEEEETSNGILTNSGKRRILRGPIRREDDSIKVWLPTGNMEEFKLDMSVDNFFKEFLKKTKMNASKVNLILSCYSPSDNVVHNFVLAKIKNNKDAFLFDHPQLVGGREFFVLKVVFSKRNYDSSPDNNLYKTGEMITYPFQDYINRFGNIRVKGGRTVFSRRICPVCVKKKYLVIIEIFFDENFESKGTKKVECWRCKKKICMLCLDRCSLKNKCPRQMKQDIASEMAKKKQSTPTSLNNYGPFGVFGI